MKTTDKIFYIANKNGANVHVAEDILGDYLSERGQEVCTPTGRVSMFNVIEIKPNTYDYEAACETLDITLYDEDGYELDDYDNHIIYQVIENKEHGNAEIRLTTTDDVEADEEYCRLAVMFLNDDNSMFFFDEAEAEQSFEDDNSNEQ